MFLSVNGTAQSYGTAQDVPSRYITSPPAARLLQPSSDVTAPTLNVSPAPSSTAVVETSSVTLSSAGRRAAVLHHRRLVGHRRRPALRHGQAVHRADPERTTLHLMAIDRAGNFDLVQGEYAPPTAVAPDAPTNLTATAGQEQATLRWSTTDTSITGYGVQLYDDAGPVGPLRETPNKTLTVTELTADNA
jgi:hypothetical protein